MTRILYLLQLFGYFYCISSHLLLGPLKSLHAESDFFFFRIVILSYQNAWYGCEIAENRTWSQLFYDGRKFREAVCKRDWHNVRLYLFFYVRKFRTVCNDLKSSDLQWIRVTMWRRSFILLKNTKWKWGCLSGSVVYSVIGQLISTVWPIQHDERSGVYLIDRVIAQSQWYGGTPN